MITVSNFSPQIILARLGCFPLLNRLFSRLIISPQFYNEVVVAGAGLPGATEVGSAVWIERGQLQDRSTPHPGPQSLSLGAGKLSAICLTNERRAHAVLLDDHQARHLAKRLSLTVMGTIGPLEAFCVRGHLPDLVAAF